MSFSHFLIRHPEDKTEEERFREWTTRARQTKTPKMTNHGYTSFSRNLHDSVFFFFSIYALSNVRFSRFQNRTCRTSLIDRRSCRWKLISNSCVTKSIVNWSIEYRIVKEQNNDSVWNLNREILSFRFLSLNDYGTNRNINLNWTIHVEINHSCYQLEMMMTVNSMDLENAFTNFLYERVQESVKKMKMKKDHL